MIPGETEPMVREGEDTSVIKHYDPAAGNPVSVFVARLVAIETNRPVDDLDPLGLHADAGELDTLFVTGFLADVDVTARVGFSYEGYRVSVSTDGTVELRDVDDGHPDRP